MLSWSAAETDRQVDLGIIVDGGRDDGGIEGGRALVAVGRAAVGTEYDTTAVMATADELGAEAAVKAASVAGAFEILNRIVDATGLPVGRTYRRSVQPIIDRLDLDGFPHAALH